MKFIFKLLKKKEAPLFRVREVCVNCFHVEENRGKFGWYWFAEEKTLDKAIGRVNTIEKNTKQKQDGEYLLFFKG